MACCLLDVVLVNPATVSLSSGAGFFEHQRVMLVLILVQSA